MGDPETAVRTLLRAMLAVLLLLGGGAAGWLPAPTEAHEACCCGMPTGSEDTCPCPKPESNRGPSRGACTERQVVVAAQAVRRVEQAQRRKEARPLPLGWEPSVAVNTLATLAMGSLRSVGGRDPDLGQHLARLNALRI